MTTETEVKTSDEILMAIKAAILVEEINQCGGSFNPSFDLAWHVKTLDEVVVFGKDDPGEWNPSALAIAYSEYGIANGDSEYWVRIQERLAQWGIELTILDGIVTEFLVDDSIDDLITIYVGPGAEEAAESEF